MSDSAAIATFFKMSDGEKLFNEVTARCFDRWRFILSFRITSKLGMQAAVKEIEEQKVTFVADIFHGSEYDKIFLNKDEFFKANPPEKLIQSMTEQTIAEARIAIDAASIVFVHSVLDAAVFDYCRVTALIAPKDWATTVEKKSIPLSEILTSSYDNLLQQKLGEYFNQLERESLLKKADLLFARCNPPANWSPMNNYEYDKNRLEKLDSYRHNIIHGGSLGEPEGEDADDDVDYMMRTALFYMGLVNLRYGLQLNPTYTFSAMAEITKNHPPS